jgi:hypothetical protein
VETAFGKAGIHFFAGFRDRRGVGFAAGFRRFFFCGIKPFRNYELCEVEV